MKTAWIILKVGIAVVVVLFVVGVVVYRISEGYAREYDEHIEKITKRG